MSTPAPIPSRPFGAAGVAMVTPFAEDGRALDLDAAQALASHLVDQGIDMLVLNGTTGESATTSDDEKCAVVDAVRAAVGGDVTILAGVGTNDTRHSIELARRTAELSAPVDGLLVVTPYYSKPSQDGIASHIEAIADATDIPVMLYDIPGRSSVPLAADTIRRLAEHPRIAALKDAKADLQEATLLMEETGLAYYSGEDALNLPWLSIGASGIVSVVGHAAPALEAQLIAAVDRADMARALAIHRALAPLVEAIMSSGPGAVNAKAAVAQQGHLPHAVVRRPHTDATDESIALILRALDHIESRRDDLGLDPGAATSTRRTQ